ncbi:MAG: glutathione S-transferase family protein, partial [Sphingomonadaceae bacterium]|nr:glutathione S-transferase family protein [Sphingomonadaceae bacterium]
LAKSPFGKIPAMTDDDYVLADSSAIVHYLEAKHPAPALIPAEPRLRGRTIWFDEFADTILAAAGAVIFFNRVVAPLVGMPQDVAAADKAEAETLPPILAYLERTIPDGGHLVGEALTLADIAVASPFANLRYAGCAVDAAQFPRTAAWAETMLARPSFASVIAKEVAFLGR